MKNEPSLFWQFWSLFSGMYKKHSSIMHGYPVCRRTKHQVSWSLVLENSPCLKYQTLALGTTWELQMLKARVRDNMIDYNILEMLFQLKLKTILLSTVPHRKPSFNVQFYIDHNQNQTLLLCSLFPLKKSATSVETQENAQISLERFVRSNLWLYNLVGKRSKVMGGNSQLSHLLLTNHSRDLRLRNRPIL